MSPSSLVINPGTTTLTMEKRKQLSTELRAAIWELIKSAAHTLATPLHSASDRSINVVPIAIASVEFARLVREAVAANFDPNLSGTLPTKRFQNGRRCSFRGNSVLLHFLDIAEQHRLVVEERLSASIEDLETAHRLSAAKSQSRSQFADVEDVGDHRAAGRTDPPAAFAGSGR